MRQLVFRVFKKGQDKPSERVMIPFTVARMIPKLIPAIIRKQLAESGFDLDAWLDAVERDIEPGVIFEREDEATRIEVLIEVSDKRQLEGSGGAEG